MREVDFEFGLEPLKVQQHNQHYNPGQTITFKVSGKNITICISAGDEDEVGLFEIVPGNTYLVASVNSRRGYAGAALHRLADAKDVDGVMVGTNDGMNENFFVQGDAYHEEFPDDGWLSCAEVADRLMEHL